MHAVARLIEDVKASNSWSNGDVARRSAGAFQRGRVQQMIKDPVRRLPERTTVDGLSVALGIPGWVVVDTFIEALGLPARPNSVTVEDAIGADPQLSADSKALLRAMVSQARATAAAAEAGWDAGSRATKVDEDARYERFLGGFERFDALTERRFRQRQQDDYDAGIGRAARRGESTADKMREAADKDAERPDDPGPDDGA